MADRPSDGWFFRVLLLRFLFVQALLLGVCILFQPRSALLLLYAGLLVGVYLCRVAVTRPRRARLGQTGCLTLSVMLLLSGVLGGASCVAYLAGFPPTDLAEHAAAAFSVVILLGPLTHHWMILEEWYYQDYLAGPIERDLGFEADTNTLKGGRKWLFFQHIQPGGVMDQAGFRSLDIVVDDGTFTEFWQRLEEARGGPPVVITVASWNDPGPVANRPARRCSVSLPRRGYSALLEKELGFRCAVRYPKENGVWTGVVVVTELVPGGIMDRAGFHERDILFDVGGVPDLFEKLEQARGRGPVTLDVVQWIDPTDLAERPVREVALAVPPAADDAAARGWLSPRDYDLDRDLGFREGWERLPHRGEWHGWPVVENLLPDGVLARAGFQAKDILFEGFSWRSRWQKARGRQPITVRLLPWMEPTPIRERARRRLAIHVPALDDSR